MAFYNTNKTEDVEVEYINNEKQEKAIERFFKAHPNEEFTPFEVQERVFPHNVPITSVRRAMTDLTSEGVLIKTEHVKSGIYGKNNLLWRLNNDKSNRH
jgi:hypothetical protein